jgi:hypothetical protein
LVDRKDVVISLLVSDGALPVMASFQKVNRVCEHVTELTYDFLLIKSAFKTTSEITYLPEVTKKYALDEIRHEKASGISIMFSFGSEYWNFSELRIASRT